MKTVILVFLLKNIYSYILENKDICNNNECDDSSAVCGIREEGEGFRLKLFENECEFIKYGCNVEDEVAYDITNMAYCEHSFHSKSDQGASESKCVEFCTYQTDSEEVCGIKRDGDGFRVRLFQNKCQMTKYNCEFNSNFEPSDFYLCDGVSYTETIEDSNLEQTTESPNEVTTDALITETTESQMQNEKFKNIIVVDNINFDNINDSIDDFFAATHVFDLPVRDVSSEINETTRRMLIQSAGPVKIFKPSVIIPKNVSEDYYHMPTLSSCFHRCPTRCPDSYAPVCGVPGSRAREPTLMFQNHCFMDVAQCKMYWEDKSPTAASSGYAEASFLFCLGEEMNAMFRFLPLIKTLQHMGRLKKKGYFRYKLSNMKFYNNHIRREPHLMG